MIIRQSQWKFCYFKYNNIHQSSNQNCILDNHAKQIPISEQRSSTAENIETLWGLSTYVHTKQYDNYTSWRKMQWQLKHRLWQYGMDEWLHNTKPIDLVDYSYHHDDFIMGAIASQITSLTHRSKKTSTLRVTGLCAGNSPVTGEFPAQRASNAENVSIW